MAGSLISLRIKPGRRSREIRDSLCWPAALVVPRKRRRPSWTNLALPNTSAITNAYDTAGRLAGTWLRNSGGTILNKHLYQYNAGGQRNQQTRTDSSYVTYGYDDDAQLQSAVGSGGQSTESLGYTYNAAWSMTQRTNSGTPVTYTINDRDQVTGDGTYTYSYDANGNRTYRTLGSAYLIYTYDDENQLIMVATDTTYTIETLRWRTDFIYDGKGRLRVRTEKTWVSGMGWTLGIETRYLYDGMRVIQERNGSNTPTVAYTRGLDLSGTREGAGGIGGLLARSHGYSGGNWSTNNNYHADGGGNVTYMIDSAQSMVATYKYDPFGRTLSSSGSLAGANVYRFSSKEIHLASGFYYYGFRFYDPATQRWLNRDPIANRDPVTLLEHEYSKLNSWDALSIHLRGPWTIYVISRANLYEFNYNNPIYYTDGNGQFPWIALTVYWGAWSIPVYNLYLSIQSQLRYAQQHPGTPYFCHMGFGVGAITLTSPGPGGLTMSLPAINLGGGYFLFMPGSIDDTVSDFFKENTYY